MPSERDAETEAGSWLDWLGEHGRHEWTRVSDLISTCRPTRNLPCRLLAATAEIDGGDRAPYLILMAGKKRRNRYWQYATRDVFTGVPHSREKALRDIERLVETLSHVAEVPHPYPKRRIRPPD